MDDDIEVTEDATDESPEEGLEGVSEDGGEDAGGESSAEEDDAWAWAKDEDPVKVQKTWNKFTEEWESLRKDRESLAPAQKIQNALDTDTGLVAAIDDYYNRVESGDPEEQVKAVKAELSDLKFEMATEKELSDVASYAKEHGYPEFDRTDLLRHAAGNRIGNLKSAYNDKFIEQIADAKRDKALADIKKSKGAAAVTTTSAATKKVGFSQKDIQAMSNEEFEKNYEAIMGQYKK